MRYVYHCVIVLHWFLIENEWDGCKWEWGNLKKAGPFDQLIAWDGFHEKHANHSQLMLWVWATTASSRAINESASGSETGVAQRLVHRNKPGSPSVLDGEEDVPGRTSWNRWVKQSKGIVWLYISNFCCEDIQIMRLVWRNSRTHFSAPWGWVELQAALRPAGHMVYVTPETQTIWIFVCTDQELWSMA